MRATRVTTPSTTLVDAAPALARARARRTAPGPRRPHRAGARARGCRVRHRVRPRVAIPERVHGA
jgi:hypothetical protein